MGIGEAEEGGIGREEAEVSCARLAMSFCFDAAPPLPSDMASLAR